MKDKSYPLRIRPRKVVQKGILNITSYLCYSGGSAYIFKKIHEEICGNHFGPRLLVQKT